MKIVSFTREETGRVVYHSVIAKIEHKSKTYEVEATIEERYDSNTCSMDTEVTYLRPDTIGDADMNEVEDILLNL